MSPSGVNNFEVAASFRKYVHLYNEQLYSVVTCCVK
jgi:hypothetical protein